MKTISVIIPTCNRPKKVRKAVKSCMKQTRLPHEIIIVDNGSSPETIKQNIQTAKLKSSKGIVEHITLPDGDVSAARNIAASYAKGDYIALLDDDDVWYTDKLKKQAQLLDDDLSIDLVGCCSSTHHSPLKIKSKYFHIKPIHAVYVCFIFPSAMLMRNHVIKNIPFRKGMKLYEDYEWLIRVSGEYKIVRTPDKLYFRGHGGVSSTSSGFDKERTSILMQLMSELPMNALNIKQAIVKFCEAKEKHERGDK